MRYTFTYLIYLAVILRSVAWNEDNPFIYRDIEIFLGVYGIVLVSEPLLSKHFPAYRWVYPLVQTGLISTMLFKYSELDFLPALFIPLSFQVIIFFGSRTGFLWIGIFSLVMGLAVLSGWDWKISGLAMVILIGSIYILVGVLSDMTQKAQKARQENQKLYEELQLTHTKLQEYAQQSEAFAIAEERHRMAQELHDSVTQTIFSMNLTVEAVRISLQTDPDRVSEHLERLQELASDAAGEIQILVSHLGEQIAGGESFDSALRHLVELRCRQDGITVHLDICGIRDLPEHARLGLYRIAQEALNNVSKHANTDQAVLRLNLDHTPAFLEIEDHGCGFDPDNLASGIDHLGLPGMAERAREIGWKLFITSQPGMGTRIRVEEAV